MGKRKEICYLRIANAIVLAFHLSKNKHGVFFSFGKVIKIEVLFRFMVENFNLIKSHDRNEVLSLLDILAEECSYSSEYYRKGRTSYGLYQCGNQ